ncbi:unnamed protein product [Coffea canephora]|uniref:Uncharacterized protein n=1 Tax=Coffea canephora TaxID=49390 RepID=A0A068US14_COFCA|nr:unnamed protein product [Coffea canephora]
MNALRVCLFGCKRFSGKHFPDFLLFGWVFALGKFFPTENKLHSPKENNFLISYREVIFLRLLFTASQGFSTSGKLLQHLSFSLSLSLSHFFPFIPEEPPFPLPPASDLSGDHLLRRHYLSKSDFRHQQTNPRERPTLLRRRHLQLWLIPALAATSHSRCYNSISNKGEDSLSISRAPLNLGGDLEVKKSRADLPLAVALGICRCRPTRFVQSFVFLADQCLS